MMRFRLRLTSILVLVCLCVVVFALGIGQAMVLADNELLFTADLRADNSDLYRMDIAHQLIYPITSDSAVDSEPDWSPDGQQIAFDSNRDGQFTIYVMDAHGGNIHRLRDDGAYAYGPSWSPDGRFMAYITTQFPISPELMLMDLQSGQTRRLTDNREVENSPTWSPDGQHLTVSYSTNTARFMNIFDLDLQTGDMNPFFVTPDNKSNLNWSADGRSLMYIAWGSNPGIYLWDIDRAQSTLIYALEGVNIRSPNGSPDGRFIVYAPSTGNNDNHIFVLDVAACVQKQPDCKPQALPLPSGSYADPRWRPRTS